MSTTIERGLTPVRALLDNGVVAIAQYTALVPAVAINATFATGSICDPAHLAGLAYFVGRVIDRGTVTRGAGDIAEALDDRGVSLRVKVTRHTFRVSCCCLADDLPDVLALLGEVAGDPVFPAEEVEKRRADAITAVRQDADSTSIRASEAVMRLLYGADHPYARAPKGTPETLGAMRRDDLLAFKVKHLVPSALRVAIVGDVNPDLALDLITAAFGGLRGGDTEPIAVPPPLPKTERQVAVVPMPGKSQSDIAYGFTAVRRLDPRFCAYWLMNNVFGQFGLGGRLADNIRERQGMAYYAFSTFDGTVGEGPLVVRAGVDPNDVERAIAAIDAEVEKLAADGPTEAELEETRESIIGSIPRMLETNEGIAEFLQVAEQFDLGFDYDRRLPALLSSVTMAEVRQAARETLGAHVACVAVAGPHAANSF